MLSCLTPTARFALSFPARRGFASTSFRLSSKLYDSADTAIDAVKKGDTVLASGFGLCGLPNTLIEALSKKPEINGLTGVSNNAGAYVNGENKGLGKLLATKQLSKVIASYIGS